MKESEQLALDYLESGIKFFRLNDPDSMKKALEQFIKANELVAEYSVRRIKILYYLALCNHKLGNSSLAFAILLRAENVARIASQLTFFVAETIDDEYIELIDSLTFELKNGNFDISKSDKYNDEDFNKILVN